MSDTTTTKPVRQRAREPKPTTVRNPTSAEGTRVPLPEQIKPASKIAKVAELLRRAEGATLDEMVEATGWLPHTTRAALTGLRKKGYVIERNKRGEGTCYKIVSSEA